MSSLLDIVTASVADVLESHTPESPQSDFQASPLQSINTLSTIEGNVVYIAYTTAHQLLTLGTITSNTSKTDRKAIVKTLQGDDDLIAGVRLIEVGSADIAVNLHNVLADVFANVFMIPRYEIEIEQTEAPAVRASKRHGRPKKTVSPADVLPVQGKLRFSEDHQSVGTSTGRPRKMVFELIGGQEEEQVMKGEEDHAASNGIGGRPRKEMFELIYDRVVFPTSNRSAGRPKKVHFELIEDTHSTSNGNGHHEVANSNGSPKKNVLEDTMGDQDGVGTEDRDDGYPSVYAASAVEESKEEETRSPFEVPEYNELGLPMTKTQRREWKRRKLAELK